MPFSMTCKKIQNLYNSLVLLTLFHRATCYEKACALCAVRVNSKFLKGDRVFNLNMDHMIWLGPCHKDRNGK